MSQTQMFARLAKVDEAKRQVTGIIASETPDAANEVFDYETSKPHFEKWSGDMAKASGGKSVGNVRAMHGKVAAGRLTDLEFDDVAKSITVTADIVDDGEWNKIMKGVYTGFSIGGKYAKKWTDPVNRLLKRYTALPSELSLVDMGCNGDATFTMVKADGIEADIKFDDTQPGLLSKINDPESPVEDQIEALKKYTNLLAKGVFGDASDPGASEDDLEKGSYTISQLARLSEDVQSLLSASMWDGYEGDGIQVISDDLKKAATALLEGLYKCVAADVDAAKSRIKAVMTKDAESASADGERLAKAATLHEALGDEVNIADIEALGKLAGSPDAIEALNKFIADNDELTKQVAAQAQSITDLTEGMAKLCDQPAPAKGAIKPVAVSKENDATLGKVADDSDKPDVKDPLALVKAAHASGGAQIGPNGIFKQVGE